eukprot:1502478-Pleurochrysis_carterae.AAC.1
MPPCVCVASRVCSASFAARKSRAVLTRVRQSRKGAGCHVFEIAQLVCRNRPASLEENGRGEGGAARAAGFHGRAAGGRRWQAQHGRARE